MPKKIPYPSSKVKEWERDRRERLNISFRELGSLLPSYNPASTLSKIEILQGAVKYIKDLHNENKTLLEKGLNKSTAKQLNQLRKRVDELSRRAQQLANLLREAGITIPNVLPDTDEGTPKQPIKWDSKTQNASVLHEKAKKKKSELKENFTDSKTQQIDSSSINTVKSAPADIKKIKYSKKSICKAVDTSLNTSINPSNLEEHFSKKCKSSKKVRKKRQTIVEQAQLIANCLRAASAANSVSAVNSCHKSQIQATNTRAHTTTSVTKPASVSQSCFVMSVTPQITIPSSSPQQISIVLPNGAGGTDVTKTLNEAITKSHLLTAPIMAASIQTCPPATVITNTGLGAGTLILANGNIVPVLPSPQFQLSTLHNSSVIMLQKNVLNTISSSAYLTVNKPQKGFAPLISKPIRRSLVDSTITTFSNKVPIPALTVRHHQPLHKQTISTSGAESKTIVNRPKTRLKLSKRLCKEKENITKQVLKGQENETEEVNNLNCSIKLNTENSNDCVTTSKSSCLDNVDDVQDNVTETNCIHIPVTDSHDIDKENVRQASTLCDEQNIDMPETESATKYILDKHKDTVQSGELETDSTELSKVGHCELQSDENMLKQTIVSSENTHILKQNDVSKEYLELLGEGNISKQTTEQHKEVCEKQIIPKDTSELWAEENILRHTLKSHDKEPNVNIISDSTKSVGTVVRSTKCENYTIDALCKTVTECAASETLNNVVTTCSSSDGITSNTPIVSVSNKHGGTLGGSTNKNDTDTSPERDDKKCEVVAEPEISASPTLTTDNIKDKMVEQPSPQNKPGSKHSTPIVLPFNKDQNPPMVIEKSVTVEFIAQPNETTEQKRNSQTNFSVNNHSDLCSSTSHEVLTSGVAVPSGGQHPESISPTAAFLLAFPLVSSSKVSDVVADSQEDVESDSLQGPTTLLQIGNIEHYPSSNKENCVSIMSEEHQVTTASSNLSTTSSSVNSVSTLVIKPFSNKSLFTKHQDKTSESTNKHSFNFPSHNAVSCAGTFLPTSEAQPCENISDEWKKLKIPCSKYDENHSEKLNHLDNIINVGTQFRSNGSCEVRPAGSLATAQPLLDTSSLGTTSFTDSSTYHITSGLQVNLPKQDTVSYVSPVPAPKYQDCNNSAHLYTPTTTFGFHNNLTPSSTCSKNSPITNSLNFTNQPTKDISMLRSFNEKEVSQGCKRLCGRSSNQVVDNQSSTGSSSNYNNIQKNVESFTYKSSATSSSSDAFKYGCAHNFSNVRSDPTVYVTSATVGNPYKYFNSNNYSVVPSHSICPPTYTQATTCREQTKPPTLSFPVAQNSSNSGILSWNTLSSAGPVGHASHCDVVQPVTMSMPQYTTSSNYTGQKSVSIPYTNNFNNPPSFTSTSNTILGNNITKQKHEKNVSSTRKTLANSKKSDDQFSNLFFGPSCESQISHNFPQNTVQLNLDVQQNNTSIKNNSICFDTFKVPSLLESKRQHSSHHRLQHRPPVNWMTTPDIRPNQNIPLVQPFGAHFTSSLNSVDSSQINKELEFCNATGDGQNSSASNSNVFTNFENRNFVNSSSFYSSNTCLQSNLYQNNTSRNKQSEPSPVQNEAQQNLSSLVSLDESQSRLPGSWVQKKGVYSIASTSSDNMFVPSTLPTLVGDLALGTSCHMTTPDEHNLNKSFANSNFSGNDHTQIPGKQIKNRHDKTLAGKNKIDMLCSNEFSGNFLGTSSGTNNFLSVSQLVDSVKSRSGSSRVDANKSHLSNKQVRQHKITSSGQKDNTAQNRGDVKNENKSLHVAQMDSTNSTICTSDIVARGMSNVQNIKDSSTRINEMSHTSDQMNLEYSSSPLLSVTDNIQWPSNSTNTSRKQTITGAQSFKTPASSYSAEALIGLNSHHNSKNSDIIQNDAAHKVITLPPPVVSDRFALQQNYHNPSQISASATFNNDTIISNNYIAPASLDLPISQSQNINYQFSINHNNLSCSPQQNQQLYTNSTLRYSSSAHTIHPQGSKIHPGSNFAHNVHPTNTGMVPVSMTSGFLPDISGSNNFLDPPNTASSFTLPPLAVTRGSKINTYNMIYSNPPVSVSSSQQLHAPRNETSHSISDHNIVKTNQNSSSDHNKRSLIPPQNHNLNNNCSTAKQRNRRRGAEPVVSSGSGFNNFVDLGYLTMPPGVGSPMLTDDGMYLNHTTNFLPVSQSGTSSMYPSASSNTHGTFYSPPRPPSCATTHRTLQQSTASPNAANSSGTTLANFNLSTIFPEIIDKRSIISRLMFICSPLSSPSSSGSKVFTSSLADSFHPTVMPPSGLLSVEIMAGGLIFPVAI
uniref:(California timema) hypothetical protein n=1 Tax=Timema californicum TaxID=61474 RepID=A0A7R9JG29_TIMCA|nr:unnamed protein product [Timema californicum]